jgi:glutathione S-transferase
MAGTLYIGTRRYSSWSLRGWLLVRLAGLEVEEVVIPLGPSGTLAVRAVSPNQLVPYLEHEGACVWESLAIAEYCAEHAPLLWPQARIARAHARAIAAEMHAGFGALRRAMPMNLGRHLPGHGQNAESLADIARVESIIAQTPAQYGAGGPYLFGDVFNAADAMYAPVMARFITYEPKLSAPTRDYVQAVQAHRLVDEWHVRAAAEPASWRLDKYENQT